MTRLTFREGNHSYWLSDDAGKRRRVPAVSALKKTLHTFDNDNWKAGQIADAIAEDWDTIAGRAPVLRAAAMKDAGLRRLAEARQFGTAVHSYAEQMWNGQPVEVPDEYRGHVAGLADWWTTNQIRLVAAEALCWADAGDFGEGPMAGRLDLLIQHPKLGLGIADMKTWRAESAGSTYPAEWAFQLAAYSQMEHLVTDDQDQPFPSVAWVGVLHVGPGTTRLWLVPDAEWMKAEDQVNAARALKALPAPKLLEEIA